MDERERVPRCGRAAADNALAVFTAAISDSVGGRETSRN